MNEDSKKNQDGPSEAAIVAETEARGGRGGRKTPAELRAERLKAQLRTNLQRRKNQARARREGQEDDRPGALLADRSGSDDDT